MAHSEALPTGFHNMVSSLDPSPCLKKPLNEQGMGFPLASNFLLTPSSSYSHLLDSLNVATLHSAEQRNSLRKHSLAKSYDLRPAVKLEGASSVMKLASPPYTTLATVMIFCVRVPVLSEQIQDVEPSVSTPSKFFTSTILACMRCAVRVRHTVTVANKPSGTLATIIPIINTKFSMYGVPIKIFKMKNKTPKNMAIPEIIKMKW
mmetsp:Transcript_53455/g.64441  ORF Transcript_53455/g.64441 Transcript_53455/m.64441 type:complete len:205 (-) Transcript_53455:979-1593(-)